MKIQIRMAKEKDIPQIQRLLKQVNLVHHQGRPDLFKFGLGGKYHTEELLEILHDEQRPILAAVDEHDTMTGYAFCIFQQFLNHNIMTDVKTLYVDDLCVDEALRGHQIGHALYEAVVAFARKHQCYNVTLNVWSCNESALKFYESCGLKPQKIGMETILSPDLQSETEQQP
jgi:ribosomal protein S18 acetylase RimI-like enzyme